MIKKNNLIATIFKTTMEYPYTVHHAHMYTHSQTHSCHISTHLMSCESRPAHWTYFSISCHYFTYLSIWGQILLNFSLSQLYDRLDFSLNTFRKHSRLLCMSDSLPGYVLIIFWCSAYLSGLGILSQSFFCCCSQLHYTRSHQNYSASYHSIVI